MNLGGSIRLNKTGFCVLFLITVLLIYVYSHKRNETGEKLVDLKQLLLVSITAAKSGGREVLATKDNLKIESKGKTKEGLNDSVTTADFKSHCIMVATLRQFFPGVHIVSEEAKTKCDDNLKVSPDFEMVDEILKSSRTDYINEHDITIWIDPLDATKEYTEKLYQYVTTMVCVAINGKPIMGVIYKPFSQETFWAWADKGQSSNLISKQKSDDKLKIVISRSHTGQLIEDLKKSIPNADVTLAAGSGYKSLEVAFGNFDAYVHSTAIKKWDICAGNAILSALGGRMTTKDNASIDYGDVTNVVNYDGLVATLKNHDFFLKKF